MVDVGEKVSKVAGVVAGGASAVAGVIAGGTSAAGLTSGLATVGSIVGGGMLAGVLVVAVAPIAGGILGIRCYRLFITQAIKLFPPSSSEATKN